MKKLLVVLFLLFCPCAFAWVESAYDIETDTSNFGTNLSPSDINVQTALETFDDFVITLEGTAILSTGETGGNKYLREDGDGTSSWQVVAGGDHDAVTLDVNADTLLSLSTQALGLDTQTANYIFSGPVSGAVAVPAFRALVANDIPDLSSTYEPAGVTASDISDQNAGTDITADLEEETHASEHSVGGTDAVFPADPNADKYLMWDDAPTGELVWATVTGGGDVSKVGTPVDNQVGIWTGDGTIEGTAGLTYDGANLQLTGDIGSTAARITKGWFTDLQVTNAIAGAVTGNAGTVTNATLTTALTVNTGTVTLTGNVADNSVLTIGAGAVSVSGANTGDQTITLTGEVTGTGAGSFAATIANDAVTYAKMQDVSATDKLLGRSTAGAGDVEEIACTAAGRAILDDANASAQRTTLGAAAALSGTINEIAYFDSTTTINSLAVASYPSLAELAYVKGVSSAIQTQLNGKQATITADSLTHADIADEDQTVTMGIWFEDPTADDDFQSIWANKTSNDFLITKIWAESDQTVTFMLQIDDGTPADVDSVDLAPAAGEAEDVSLDGDTTLAAGEELDLAITSVSGTPTWVSIQWTGLWVDN